MTSAKEFFISKYVLKHFDIIDILEGIDIKMPNTNDENILYRAGAKLWHSLDEKNINSVNKMYSVWMCTHEEKAAPVKIHTDSEVKRHIDLPIKSRKLTSQIYQSTLDRILSDHLLENEQSAHINLYDKYKLIYRRMREPIFMRLWEAVPTYSQGIHRGTNYKHLFDTLPYARRAKLITAFPDYVMLIHLILQHSDIYRDYPKFDDYENIAAHILLSGDKTCTDVVNGKLNPYVRSLIVNNKYFKIYN